ncbi:O-antigen ligase family protein [Bizionia sp. APA-3]|nr:O-antigen ligase family protein [Bizionia sp. APA-3]
MNRFLLNLLILFSILYNIFLFARTSLVVFTILLILIFMKWNKRAVVVAVILCGVFLALDKNTYTLERISINSSTNDIYKRMDLNKVSYDIFKEAPFFGVGPGRIRYERTIRYYETGYVIAYKNLYNSHNQYLNYLSVNGLFGLLVFLSMLFYMLFVAIKRNQIFLISTILLFSISCLTESYLVRNKGIVLFSFIITIFLIYNIDVFQKCKKKPITN